MNEVRKLIMSVLIIANASSEGESFFNFMDNSFTIIQRVLKQFLLYQGTSKSKNIEVPCERIKRFIQEKVRGQDLTEFDGLIAGNLEINDGNDENSEIPDMNDICGDFS